MYEIIFSGIFFLYFTELSDDCSLFNTVLIDPSTPSLRRLFLYSLRGYEPKQQQRQDLWRTEVQWRPKQVPILQHEVQGAHHERKEEGADPK